MYPTPANERSRLLALYEYELLDTMPEEDYDNITKIAAQICNAEVSLITLIAEDRQWFKSHHGTEISGTPREIAFCNYTIIDKDNVLVVSDLRMDKRFAQNPLVTGEPNVVFYAGAPLTTADGFVLGTICVLDKKTQTLNSDQVNALKALAREVMSKFELRKNIKELTLIKQQLEITNVKLKEFALIVSHDIKMPVANIAMLSASFKKTYAKVLDETANQYLDLINESAKEQLAFIDQVLKRCDAHKNKNMPEEEADPYTVINKVIGLVGPPDDIEIKLSGSFPLIPLDQTAAQQVFQNLITNAIKYNDKEKGLIHIMSDSDDSYLYFNISDNGRGIEKQDLAKIFNERQTLNKTDRYGNKGMGLGLATVKKIIESNGGRITVSSKLNIGTEFKISLPRHTA